MNFKSIVHNIIDSRLNLLGFELIGDAPKHYEFRHRTNGQIISFDILPYGPASIAGDFFSALKADSSKRFSALSVLYSIQKIDGSYINIDSSQFTSVMAINGDFIYCTQQELEDKTMALLDDIEKVVIPFMNDLSTRFIIPPATAYENLAENTQAKALYAQQKYDLSPAFVDCKGIEAALISLRGENKAYWKERFNQSLNDVISLAAYIGEVIIQSGSCGNWDWQTTSPIKTKSRTYLGGKYFRVTAEYDRKYKTYDSLQLICSFWNFYPFLRCCRLDPIGSGNLSAIATQYQS